MNAVTGNPYFLLSMMIPALTAPLQMLNRAFPP